MTVRYEYKGSEKECFHDSYLGTISAVHWYTYGYEGGSLLKVFFKHGHHLEFVGVEKVTFEIFMKNDSPSVEVLFKYILPNYGDSCSKSSSSSKETSCPQ